MLQDQLKFTILIDNKKRTHKVMDWATYLTQKKPGGVHPAFPQNNKQTNYFLLAGLARATVLNSLARLSSEVST